MWRRRKGLYFFSSIFSVFSFLLRVVVYREGDFPSLRASVHSKVTISRGILVLFFLFCRALLGFFFFFDFSDTGAVHGAKGAKPALAQCSFTLKLGLRYEPKA